jgi:spore maturation protein CgeB
MRILIAGHFLNFWYEEAWARALRELGHEVATFEIASRFRGTWQWWQYRVKIGPRVRQVNDELIRTVGQFKPQIVLFYQPLVLFPPTIARLRDESSALLVCYNNDNAFSPAARWRRWRLFRQGIPHYHLHLVYRHSDLAPYRQAGAGEVIVLRSHYLPWIHRRLDLGESARAFWASDIGFFGHCEPDVRLQQMAALMRELPANYRLHGSRWDTYGQGTPWQDMDTHKLQGEDYVKAINATRMALCFLSQYYNFDTYTRRCFEIPACGTMMLSQRTDDLLTLYEEDREAAFFSSAEELVDKARFYLHNDAARRRVAEAGWRRCTTSGYDIYSRMREWLAVAGEMVR